MLSNRVLVETTLEGLEALLLRHPEHPPIVSTTLDHLVIPPISNPGVVCGVDLITECAALTYIH